MKKAIFFDLDGTLLPMDQKKFEYEYFKLAIEKFAALGYNPETFQSALWGGIKAMWSNPGEITNEELFWKEFKKVYPNAEEMAPLFKDYYFNEYNKIESIVTKDESVRKIVDWCNQNFEYVILATNPFFPTYATQNRMAWIGLKPEDFTHITTYETSYYSKPNKEYYKKLLDKYNLKAEECIMVGNNELEDYIVTKELGFDAILAGDFILPYKGSTTTPTSTKLCDLINAIKQIKESY